MKHTVHALFMFLLTFAAHAETSRLRADGDLMIHPAQLAVLLQAGAKRIAQTGTFDIPTVNFTKPYRTSWAGVRALGPIDLALATDALATQELGVELTWDRPSLAIGQFTIDDTIRRNVGGAEIIIRLTGQCTGMSMTIPEGGWKIKGHLAWSWGPGGPVVTWRDFAFTRNADAKPIAELGTCTGPSGLSAALREAFDVIARDQSLLQDSLREAALDRVRSALLDLQSELTKPRAVALKPGLDLVWQPAAVSAAGSGLLRIAGALTLEKQAAANSEVALARTYAEAQLSQVTESGFVLPRDTMPELLKFMHAVGDLGWRVPSRDLQAFASLMQNRFLQFFLWPDLLKYDATTAFVFDVTTSRAPTLDAGQTLASGGVSYAVTTGLLVHQWVPAGGQYVPYVDFTSPLRGQLEARVAAGQLALRLAPGELDVSARFFKKGANPWLATSLLGDRVSDYLKEKTFVIDLPTWTIADVVNLSVRDVQQWKQSFRVPLEVD